MPEETQAYRITVTLEEIKPRSANVVGTHFVNFDALHKLAILFFNIVCAKMYYSQNRLITFHEEPREGDLAEAALVENRLELVA